MEKTYETDNLIIHWKPELCEHARECVRGLPQVFDVNKKPWVMPENASDEEIMKVIDRCPSKALSYEIKNKGELNG